MVSNPDYPGGSARADDLWPALYDELRALARRHLRSERPDHTLQPTALVNEAYVRLARQSVSSSADRDLFLSAAASAIRRILIDHARRRTAAKRGGGVLRVSTCDGCEVSRDRDLDLLALDEALGRLTRLDAQQARIVELRFFAGMTIEGVALALGVTPGRVKDEWASARAFLAREIGKGDAG